MGSFKKLAVVFSFAFFLPPAVSSEVLFENSSENPVFHLIQSAKKRIDIEIYQIGDLRVQSALLDAMNRNVKVRIVQESEAVGSNCPVFEPVFAQDTFLCRVQKEFVSQVLQKGGVYIPFSDQELCSIKGRSRCLQHGKMMLIDGKEVLISTGNFNPTNLCDPEGVAEGELLVCNRDYSVLSSDPEVVSVMESIFEADLSWKKNVLQSILKTEGAKKVTVSPYALDPILKFIQSAKKSILLENQYLRHPEMNAALIEASKRGVKVRLIVNSICTFEKPDPVQDSYQIKQWKKTFHEFDLAGIESRNFTRKITIQNHMGYLHSKVIIVDEKKAWVGSINGSMQAFSMNREFGLWLEDPDQVKKLVRFVQDDIEHPDTESWQESLNCLKD